MGCSEIEILQNIIIKSFNYAEKIDYFKFWLYVYWEKWIYWVREWVTVQSTLTVKETIETFNVQLNEPLSMFLQQLCVYEVQEE